ncbi:hypothetical protein ACHAWF_003545 [Thalassiosira exigua]
MKRFRTTFTLPLLALALLWGTLSASPSTLAYASASEGATSETNPVAAYEPSRKKKGLGRVLDWGLAKLEGVYDHVLVSDLITAFVAKCDNILAMMVHSVREMTMSYDELHEKEVTRLREFDEEFRDLVKLRNRIDRKCLYSRSVEDRSLCVEKGMDIQDKIRGLRSQRSKSESAIERYKDMIEWCASYNNWLC